MPNQSDNSSKSSSVKTIYTVNNKKVDATKKNYKFNIPDGKFDVNINNVRITGDDKQLKEISVSGKTLSITFK